jgi:glutamate--cysteine ligase
MSDVMERLHEILTAKADAVEDFLAYHRNQVVCPVYTSVDIRRNACKAAVVDANAFPAGFNNLAKRSHDAAADAIRNYMTRMYPEARDFLILAENHTRNKWYFQHLKVLGDLFARAGFAVTLGTLNAELFPAIEVETAEGDRITLHGVLREGRELIADGTVHDVVVLNNDLSTGPPDILDGLSQPVTPPPVMGWHRRRKSEHFRIVQDLARQLGTYVGFDPWCISAEFERVEGVDFKSRTGLDRVAASVDAVLERTRAKYAEYGIKREPNVFIKADAGTYGMGITTATSGDEFLKLNSRGRERMAKGKEGVATTSVIVQEGVPTAVRSTRRGAEAQVAEPVMYMVCGRVVGGFNRVHGTKGEDENLNAPGAVFHPLSFVMHDGEPGEDETVLDPVSATGYELLQMEQPDAGIPVYP